MLLCILVCVPPSSEELKLKIRRQIIHLHGNPEGKVISQICWRTNFTWIESSSSHWCWCFTLRLLHFLTLLREHWLSPVTTSRVKPPTTDASSHIWRTLFSPEQAGRQRWHRKEFQGMKSNSEHVIWQFCCGLKLSSLWNYLGVTATAQTGRTTNVIKVPAAERTMVGVMFPSRVTHCPSAIS